MENKEEILKRLQDEDAVLQAEALQQIKTTGDLSITPELLDLLSSEKSHEGIRLLISLLADIKENSFREIMVARIKATTDSATRALLVRVCWESALDYSNYIGLFAEMLIKEDFATALEAATLLEETLHNLTDEQRNALHRQLEAVPKERQFLIENLQ